MDDPFEPKTEAEIKRQAEERFPDGAPWYIGQYFVEFVDGSGRLLNLVGSIRDTSGTPIYLVGHDETFYAYHNVIFIRKVKPNG